MTTPQQATGKAFANSRGSDARSRRGVGGPFSNTGRKVQRKGAAHVDWFGVSLTLPESLIYPTAKAERLDCDTFAFLKELLFALFGTDEVSGNGGGWAGYLHRWNFGPGGSWGLIAFGGAHQKRTVNIQLSGTGCATVNSWRRIAEWGRGHIQLTDEPVSNVRITRLDLAHDDHEAENVDIDRARQWYAEGEFITRGTPPSASMIDDMGSGDGKTFYVGRRENGKLCRVYEKGRELGDKSSEWVRVEVEWRGKDRWIPWDALERPAEFLAAAYPCLSFIAEVKQVIDTIKRSAEMTIDRLRVFVKRQAGRALYALVAVNGGDISQVFEDVVREKWPTRLQKYDDMGLEMEGMTA